MEAEARQVYLSLHSKSPLSVKECGMFVDAELGFLGASPDGIVKDEAATDTHGLLEIKCPVGTVSVETLASQDKSFCLSFDDSRLCLKRTHACYSQVQMQMAIVDCAWADFFVYTH